MDEDDFDLSENQEDVEVIYLDGEIDLDGNDEVDDGFDLAAPLPDEEFDVVDTSKITFTQHSRNAPASLFCCDFNKTADLAVTGGEDDNAFVWDPETATVVIECTGHQDSVIEAAFNFDNTLIATADMGGMVQVWNVKEKKLIWCGESDDLAWMQWHPLANVVVAGCQSGEVYVWQVPQGHCKVLPSHGTRCVSGRIHPDGKRLITGYDDGQIKLWDLKAATAIWQLSEPLGKEITSLEINNDGALISVAPTGTILKVADGKTVATLLAEGEKEIEAHLFFDELGVFISGSLSGQICVWDLSRQTIRHRADIGAGVTIMKKSPNGRVVVGTNEGTVYVCDVRTTTLLDTLTGHTEDIFDLAVSYDGTKILTACSDGTAKIFVIKQQ